eukprot:CAMPEP_0171955532 /NCGR_PEP_ID=MMETSP0993-20121228/113387_1 /TAXON_ID=483369 /ORGANISM="non described non described, Strain CCMP2098" /LENGTH=330 /DNA_ID=CAMNT_0012601815 /DNA_START=1 /DNA_END=996 /DNA_ORIENTATION=+
MVSRLSSTETLGKFMKTAPVRVQSAMETTVRGLLGGMTGPFATDSATVTSAETLKSLMFQLQMTGYMFKNADYRLSLRQSLGGQMDKFADKADAKKEKLLLPVGGGDGAAAAAALTEEEESAEGLPAQALPVTGTIKVTGGDGTVIEVDADAYMAELRGEVDKLRGDLMSLASKQEERHDEREDALANDLVSYVNGLPKDEMAELTTGIQSEVLESMEALVYGILRQFGVTEGERLMLNSSDALQKLCMWQLVIGYNLRELEVREEFKRQFENNEVASEFEDVLKSGQDETPAEGDEDEEGLEEGGGGGNASDTSGGDNTAFEVSPPDAG